MSMYAMLHGRNPDADLLLAVLGLSRDDVGRFRDAFVSDGQIAVYTRNGGGNRDCWHADSPEWGRQGCKHESYQAETDETVDKEGPAAGCCNSNVLLLGEVLHHRHATGKRIMETRYRCLAPDSAECACVGCTIQYRLRKHPLYITDRDDDFDCTYATIYFCIPETADFEKLRAMDIGKFDPDARWHEAIEAIRTMAIPAKADPA
jgi:hypothetical protein